MPLGQCDMELGPAQLGPAFASILFCLLGQLILSSSPPPFHLPYSVTAWAESLWKASGEAPMFVVNH